MTSSPLLASLLRAWDRALATSGAADLPREFVNVVLPLMPESAPDLLRALRDGPDYNEEWLLRDHAPLLGRHARDLFLDRVMVLRFPFSPAELIADAALAVTPEERTPFRERALAAIAAEQRPDRRVGALLKWARAEPADVARRLTDEALALVPALTPGGLSQLAHLLESDPDPRLRAALLARAAGLGDDERDSSVLLAECKLAAPADRAPLALAAVAHSARHGRPGHYFFTALVARDLVGFAPLRECFERHLRELATLRELRHFLDQVGADLPPALLDLAEERMRAMDAETWRLAMAVAELSVLHAPHREGLRVMVRAMLAHIVGDPLRGHQMEPSEYNTHGHLDVLRAAVGMTASAAFEDDERRLWQLRALAIVEGTDTSVARCGFVDTLPWDTLGASLHPSLHAEAARVALGIRHRPTALKALGELVAALPPSGRHLALLGLARLADGASPEGLARALAALEAAPPRSARSTTRRKSSARAAAAWTAADEAALVAFTAALRGSAYMESDRASALCAALTPPAARRAAAVALALDGSARITVALALAACPLLVGTAERETLVEALLVPEARSQPTARQLAGVARCVAEICSGQDAAWAARVGAFFDGHAWNVDELLDAFAAFAPALRRLGGAALGRDLAARLRTPVAPTELSRPWAQAARGAFDA